MRWYCSPCTYIHTYNAHSHTLTTEKPKREREREIERGGVEKGGAPRNGVVYVQNDVRVFFFWYSHPQYAQYIYIIYMAHKVSKRPSAARVYRSRASTSQAVAPSRAFELLASILYCAIRIVSCTIIQLYAKMYVVYVRTLEWDKEREREKTSRLKLREKLARAFSTRTEYINIRDVLEKGERHTFCRYKVVVRLKPVGKTFFFFALTLVDSLSLSL